MATKFVYFFGDGRAEGRGDMKDVLGGKGAGLAEMTNSGVPVPPGFTVTTEVCRHTFRNEGRLPEGFQKQEDEAVARLEQAAGKRLGDPNDPLLVSVRSGAKFSMPGMMDTILNLGLNEKSVEGLARKTGNERFARDSYRRFIQMFGGVVLGVEKKEFEHLIEKLKGERGVKDDVALTVDDLKRLAGDFKKLVHDRTGAGFPDEPREQLRQARDAVFRSWGNDRAIYYRRQNKISDDLGTAVNVQMMVFGNMGETSGTGVGFTRNPATGEKAFFGEFLLNAQGEDVVAGIRTPRPISELQKEMPDVYAQLREITGKLERHYLDVQDFEFTIQEGRLFMLQTRVGKRTGPAAVKIAVDMVNEKFIDKETAILRVEPDQLDQLLHRQVDPKAKPRVLAKGLAASPGAASGRVVFDPDTAVERAKAGERVILVRNETNPDDIHGMDAAQGILTATGGMTSHAAVVARGMGKCCVAGCSAIRVEETARRFTIGDSVFKESDWITINGSTGEVLEGDVPTIEPGLSGEFATFMEWVGELQGLKVRANADVPRDALKAREFGAEGIGLCRTEHMFFAEERLPHVQEMILWAPEAKERRSRVEALRAELERARDVSERGRIATALAAAEKAMAPAWSHFKGSLDALLPFQREDFKGVFRAMAGYPVTIRTLDPPLHEFLPKREELMVEIAVGEAKGAPAADLEEKKRLLRRVEQLHEFNPMLGHRGCRLGITFPEITEMQATAIFEAACALKKEKVEVIPEIMIPLVGTAAELEDQRRIVVKAAEEVMRREGIQVPYLVGTMIEIPRAAVRADEIAGVAQFFSFGTNDLTQMTFGFSRDDAGKFLPDYVQRGILSADPFVTVDQEGVGDLMRLAVERGRGTRKDLKIGICGEHGGDPASVGFCHKLGLDYVSCSPFRVPIARLASAHSKLREGAMVQAASL
jgi:pyruvate,orthophosphate dikinase